MKSLKKKMKFEEIKRIRDKYDITTNDAIIIFYLNSIVRIYETFLQDTLQIEKDPDASEYQSELPPVQYYNELQKITDELIKMETQLKKTHTEVARVYSQEIQDFITKIESLPSKGNKDVVLQTRTKLRNFRLRISDMIKLGDAEKMLDSVQIAQEDRAQKVWNAGLKKLAKHEEAVILLYWLIEHGKGIAMTKREITVQIGKGDAWVEKHLSEIKQNALELLSLGQGLDNKITYAVPKIFNRFYFGKGEA